MTTDGIRAIVIAMFLSPTYSVAYNLVHKVVEEMLELLATPYYDFIRFVFPSVIAVLLFLSLSSIIFTKGQLHTGITRLKWRVTIIATLVMSIVFGVFLIVISMSAALLIGP